MNALFTNLPENSKVWIYQSPREFTPAEVGKLNSLIHDFVAQWSSHSRKVIADGAVVYNRFIVLAADETAFNVSGCSIDSSVSFIRQLEQQFAISLFDRLSIAWRDNGNISVASQADFQKLLDEGKATQDTIVFNNLVATVKDFRENWEVPLSQSWHARFFKVQVS